MDTTTLSKSDAPKSSKSIWERMQDGTAIAIIITVMVAL